MWFNNTKEDIMKRVWGRKIGLQIYIWTVWLDIIWPLWCASCGIFRCGVREQSRQCLYHNTWQRQSGRNFADDILKLGFFCENWCILIQITLKFIPMDTINNKLALLQAMAWHCLYQWWPNSSLGLDELSIPLFWYKDENFEKPSQTFAAQHQGTFWLWYG